MKRHLYCLSNSVWNADDYLHGRNCDPIYTYVYLFGSDKEAKGFAMNLDTDDDIFNDCTLFDGEIDEETILELTGFESIKDFNDALKEPYSKDTSVKNFGEDEKGEVAAHIIGEFDSSAMPVDCANYDFNKSICGSIIVVWSWQTHVGYARECEEIRYAQYGEDETMLTKQDKTFVKQVDVVMTKEHVEKCKDLQDELYEKLFCGTWKWTNPEFVKKEISKF